MTFAAAEAVRGGGGGELQQSAGLRLFAPTVRSVAE